MYFIFLLFGLTYGKTIGQHSADYLKWNIMDGVIPDGLASDRGCDRELKLSTSSPSNYVPISCADIRYSVYDKHKLSLDPLKVDVTRQYSMKLSDYENGVCKIETSDPHVDTVYNMYTNGKISPFLNRYGYCEGTMNDPTLLDEILITTESCDDIGHETVNTPAECTVYSGAPFPVPEVSDQNLPFGCNDGKFNSYDRSVESDHVTTVVATMKSNRAAEIKAEYDALKLDTNLDPVPVFSGKINTTLLPESETYTEVEISYESQANGQYCANADSTVAYQCSSSYYCNGPTNSGSNEQITERCFQSCNDLDAKSFLIDLGSNIYRGRCRCFMDVDTCTTSNSGYASYKITNTNVVKYYPKSDVVDARLENIARQVMSVWNKANHYRKLEEYVNGINTKLETARSVAKTMRALNNLYKYYTDSDLPGIQDKLDSVLLIADIFQIGDTYFRRDLNLNTNYTWTLMQVNDEVAKLSVDAEKTTLGQLLGDGVGTYKSLYDIYEAYMEEYNDASVAEKCVMDAKHRYRTTVIGCIPGLDFDLKCHSQGEVYINAPDSNCYEHNWGSSKVELNGYCATICSDHTTADLKFFRLFHVYTANNVVESRYNNDDYSNWQTSNPIDTFNNTKMWHMNPNVVLGRTDLSKEDEYKYGSSPTLHGFRLITDNNEELRSEYNSLECPFDKFCIRYGVQEEYKLQPRDVIYNDDGSELHYFDYVLRYSYYSWVTMKDFRSIYDNTSTLVYSDFEKPEDNSVHSTSNLFTKHETDTLGRGHVINSTKNEIIGKEEILYGDDTHDTSDLDELYNTLSKKKIPCSTNPCNEGDWCFDFSADLTIPEFNGEFYERNAGGLMIDGYQYIDGDTSTAKVHPRRKGDNLFFSRQSKKDNNGFYFPPSWGVFTDLNGNVKEMGYYKSTGIPTSMDSTFQALKEGYVGSYTTYNVKDKLSFGNFQSTRACLRELCYDRKFGSVEAAKDECHDHCISSDGMRVYWDPSQVRDPNRLDHKAFECSCGDPLDEFECVMMGKQWKGDIYQTQYRYEAAEPEVAKAIVSVPTYLYCPLSDCTQGYVDKKCGRGNQGMCSSGSWFNNTCIAPGEIPFCKNEFVEAECMCLVEPCEPGYYCTKAGECMHMVRKDKKMLKLRYNHLENP